MSQASPSKGTLLAFGAALPTLALALDYFVLRRLGFGVVDLIGAGLGIARPVCLYVTSACCSVSLGAWLLLLQRRAALVDAYFGGVFVLAALFNAVCALAIFQRMMTIPEWIVPLTAAPVFGLIALDALASAASKLPRWVVGPSASIGAASVLAVTFSAVEQPWALMRRLPDARNADLAGSDLSRIYLDGCRDVTLEGANLGGVDLRYARLQNCNLSMRGAVLRSARLEHAYLSVVNLSQADLQHASLDDTTLYAVDLRGADLRHAKLGAFFQGRVDLRGADLRGADLRRMRHPDGIFSWEGVVHDASTRFPPGFDPGKPARERAKGATLAP